MQRRDGDVTSEVLQWRGARVCSQTADRWPTAASALPQWHTTGSHSYPLAMCAQIESERRKRRWWGWCPQQFLHPLMATVSYTPDNDDACWRTDRGSYVNGAPADGRWHSVSLVERRDDSINGVFVGCCLEQKGYKQEAATSPTGWRLMEMGYLLGAGGSNRFLAWIIIWVISPFQGLSQDYQIFLHT